MVWGQTEIKLIEFNTVQTKVLDKKQKPDEFNLNKLKQQLKGRICQKVLNSESLN